MERTLGTFLKSWRRRIDRNADYLGTCRRLQSRLGRIVSRGEVAEAVDVSRGWYSLIEPGSDLRASTRLVPRIAEAPMLSGEERTQLFTPCGWPVTRLSTTVFPAIRRH
jgi:hypothetical protein